MDVFFETIRGSFCIELGYFDTVLEIKEKIEKYQNIPVSKQTLFFNGKVLLQEGLDAKILHNSRLHILCTNHNHSSYEVLTQTEQSSPVPSNSIGNIIYGQDLPLTTEHFSNIQAFWPAKTEETSNVRDSPARNNDQVLQTEKSTLSNSTEQIINDQDLPVTVQELQTEQSPLSNSVKEIINIPDSAVKMRSNKRYPKRTKVASNNNNNNLALQMEESPPLKSAKQLINVQDCPVKVVRRNKKSKVLETEKSPPSNSVKEINNSHQDAPRTPVKVVRRNKKNDQVLETEKSPPSNSNKRDR